MLLRGLPTIARIPPKLLAGLLVVSFFDETAAFIPAGTLEAFRSDLGLTYAQAGSVISILAVGGIVGSAGSVAIDHASRRALASVAAGTLAASMAAFAVAPGYPMLLLASFLHGVASTVLMDTTSVSLTAVVGEARLRPYLARSNLAGVAGDLAGPILLWCVLALGWSWRVAFGWMSCLVAGYTLLLASLPLPPPPPRGGGRSAPLAGLRVVLADRQVWLIGWISLLTISFDEPFLAFLLARAEQLGMSPARVTLVALVSVGGGVLAYGYLETLTRSLSDRALIGSGAALAAFGSVVAGAVDRVGALAAGGAVVGVGIALAWIALEHRQLTVRPGLEGTSRALIGMLEAVGLVVPVLVGLLVDRTSLAVGVAAHAALAILVVLSVRGLRSS